MISRVLFDAWGGVLDIRIVSLTPLQTTLVHKVFRPPVELSPMCSPLNASYDFTDELFVLHTYHQYSQPFSYVGVDFPTT